MGSHGMIISLVLHLPYPQCIPTAHSSNGDRNAGVTASGHCAARSDAIAENKYIVCKQFMDMFDINTYIT